MTVWQKAAADVAGTLLTAAVIPASLFVTLLIVRSISYLWYAGLNRRALPVIVNDVGSCLDPATESASDVADRASRVESLADLPYLLREYVAADPPLSRQLAPDVAVAISPDIPLTTRETQQSGWAGSTDQPHAAAEASCVQHLHYLSSLHHRPAHGQRRSREGSGALDGELEILLHGDCCRTRHAGRRILHGIRPVCSPDFCAGRRAGSNGETGAVTPSSGRRCSARRLATPMPRTGITS